MKNRIAGYIVLGIDALIGFIVYSFNLALGDIINDACTHGPSCPMWGTLDFQTNVGIGIMTFIFIIGLYLIFFGREERVITKIETKIEKVKVEPKEITKENYQNVLNSLEEEEKKIFEILIESKGTMYQSELIGKTGLNKVQITRILDKLEGKGLLERKRRGMTNVVTMKH